MASLAVVIGVGALTAVSLQLQSSHLSRLQTENDKKCAFYLAEAALAEAFASLQNEGSGCIGNEQEPAAFGNGFVFTEVFEEEGGILKIESYGIQGHARQHLGMVVQKEYKPLAREGFFGRESLVVNPGTVTLVDKQAYMDRQQAIADAIAAAKLDNAIDAAECLPMLPEDIIPRLGSDGVILLFGGTGTLETQIFADVRPGPGSTMLLPTGCTILGSRVPRPEKAYLPEIHPPEYAASGDIRPRSGQSLSLSTDARKGVVLVPNKGVLYLTGPLSLVVDQFWVQPGGTVIVDGSAGPVDLFVLDRFLVEAGAAINNVGGEAGQFRIQVAAQDSVVSVVDRFQFLTTAPFIGQVYAPDANVVLPPNSRFKGSIAAWTLVTGSRSLLEHDPLLMVDGLFATNYASLNWRLLQVPDSIADVIEYDPQAYYAGLGQDPPMIAEAEVSIEEVVRFVSPETGKVLTYRGDLTKLPPERVGAILDTILKTDPLFDQVKVPTGVVDDNLDDDKPPPRG